MNFKLTSNRFRPTNIQFNILLFTIPVSSCLGFWYNAISNSKIDPVPYFSMLLLFYLYYLVRGMSRNYSLLSVLSWAALSILCVFFFQADIKTASFYLISFNTVFYGLYIVARIDFSMIDLKILRRDITIFAILFVAVYELSVPFAKGRVTEVAAKYNLTTIRTYREGFVISHAACYYLSCLGFILFLLKRRFLAIGLWSYAATTGARIGYIYIFCAIFTLVLMYSKPVMNIVYKYRYILLGAIVLVTAFVAERIYSSSGIGGLSAYTSGRSNLWNGAIAEMKKNSITDFVNLFGRGPGSTQIFNYNLVRSSIWMHNDFFEVLFSFGIVGLVAYLSIFISYFKKVRFVFLFLVFFLAGFFNGFVTYDALFITLINTFVFRRFVEGSYINLRVSLNINPDIL